MFQEEQIMLNALRFCKCIQSQGIASDRTIIYVGLFDNKAVEEALLENILNNIEFEQINLRICSLSVLAGSGAISRGLYMDYL